MCALRAQISKILINNLMYIISTHLYFNNTNLLIYQKRSTNLLNHIINTK